MDTLIGIIAITSAFALGWWRGRLHLREDLCASIQAAVRVN